VEFDTGVGGSRVTRMAGLAAMRASADAAQQLYRITADLFGWPEEQLAVEGEAIVRRDTGERRPWAELLERIGGSITGRGSAVDPERSPVTSFTAQVAEVSVDPETGQVRLLRLTTAHDVGAVLNPLDHQAQIDGAVIQGVGFAMTEELGVEDGRVSTVTFGDYKIPGIADIPRLDTVLLESDFGSGPYHARGIGENPSGCVAPAIANAVADAVGARIHSLPITAEKVYHAVTGG
jgi:xanthine dehydrogenase molybdenum-binding subunit